MLHPTIRLPRQQIEEVCRRYSVRELSLFGSAVSGEFTPQSDLDFLVEFQPGSVITLVTLGALEQELADLTGRRVDLIPKRGLKPLVREPALNGREIVYAA
jgi:uncharacterized protein